MKIEWTSESHIKALLQAAGWPSALLWHKQRGHVPLLFAEGTPPHNFQWAGLSCPLQITFGPVFWLLAFSFSGTAPNPQAPVRISEDIKKMTYWTCKLWYFDQSDYEIHHKQCTYQSVLEGDSEPHIAPSVHCMAALWDLINLIN